MKTLKLTGKMVKIEIAPPVAVRSLPAIGCSPEQWVNDVYNACVTAEGMPWQREVNPEVLAIVANLKSAIEKHYPEGDSHEVD